MTRLLIAASGTGGHLFRHSPSQKRLKRVAPCDGWECRTGWKTAWCQNARFNHGEGGWPSGPWTQKTRAAVPTGLPASVCSGSSSANRSKRCSPQVVTSRPPRSGGALVRDSRSSARVECHPRSSHAPARPPVQCRRRWSTCCRPTNPGKPADRHRHPVRAAFLTTPQMQVWVPRGDGPILLVMGGSHGAVGLNRMVRPILPKLLNQGCRVVHLSGGNDPESNHLQHPNLAERSFSDEIPGLLQHADLAVS